MLLVNVPNRMYPNYSKIFLLNLTQFNPVASPPENQKYILVHTTFFAFFFLITQIAPNSRILLSRVLNGNGRFCSSYEVSPSSFRYYSSSVEYLSGILTKTNRSQMFVNKNRERQKRPDQGSKRHLTTKEFMFEIWYYRESIHE